MIGEKLGLTIFFYGVAVLFAFGLVTESDLWMIVVFSFALIYALGGGSYFLIRHEIENLEGAEGER